MSRRDLDVFFFGTAMIYLFSKARMRRAGRMVLMQAGARSPAKGSLLTQITAQGQAVA
jgi:hypothetical protein